MDLPDVSIPRVHLPALLLVLPAAALGLESFRRHGRWQGGVGIVTILWAASAAPIVLESTNGDAEETLIQRLHEEVADEPLENLLRLRLLGLRGRDIGSFSV